MLLTFQTIRVSAVDLHLLRKKFSSAKHPFAVWETMATRQAKAYGIPWRVSSIALASPLTFTHNLPYPRLILRDEIGEDDVSRR
jgi:hypothetical protein